MVVRSILGSEIGQICKSLSSGLTLQLTGLLRTISLSQTVLASSYSPLVIDIVLLEDMKTTGRHWLVRQLQQECESQAAPACRCFKAIPQSLALLANGASLTGTYPMYVQME